MTTGKQPWWCGERLPEERTGDPLWRESPVGVEGERIEVVKDLGTGTRALIARVAPWLEAEVNGAGVVIAWEDSPVARKARRAVERELTMLLAKEEPGQRWAYLCYHCGTAGNLYGSLGGGVYFTLRKPEKRGFRSAENQQPIPQP